MNDLVKDLKKKIISLYQKKQFQKLERVIETLGNLDKQPDNFLMVYAAAKCQKQNPSNVDLETAIKIFEKIYNKNKNNLEAFYNLLATSLRIKKYIYVYPHLIDRYKNYKKDKKVISALSTINVELLNIDEACKYAEELTRIEPDNFKTWEHLMSISNYVNKSQKYYRDLAFKFDKSFETKFPKYDKSKKKNKKKVVLGIVSSNLKTHSVSFFLKDVLRNIDKNNFQLLAFSNLNTLRHDEVTSELKTYFDEWHNTFDLSDEDFLNLVRSSDLDILIDCNGLTALNRVECIRARCAPIQISWLGYCNTLGVENLDYILVDPYLIKQEESKFYSEKILPMPQIWNAMSPLKNLPDVNELPVKRKSIFTFGSFNNFQKISNETIIVWSNILNQTGSQLILKSSSKSSDEAVENLKSKFSNYLKNMNRLIFLDKISDKENHLKVYNDIDVALDTFPYPGVTTSFESILMGVPVLTMKGFNFNSRCGESINSNLNMNEFLAENEKDYLDKAINITKDIDHLSNIRQSLRHKALKSPLFDIKKFTNDFSLILKNLSLKN